jgi:hypothetical protein
MHCLNQAESGKPFAGIWRQIANDFREERLKTRTAQTLRKPFGHSVSLGMGNASLRTMNVERGTRNEGNSFSFRVCSTFHVHGSAFVHNFACRQQITIKKASPALGTGFVRIVAR